MKAKPSQGRRLVQLLKRKAMTYMEMNMLGISVSPHKRVAESLRADEQVVKGERNGMTTWRVVAASNWTA